MNRGEKQTFFHVFQEDHKRTAKIQERRACCYVQLKQRSHLNREQNWAITVHTSSFWRDRKNWFAGGTGLGQLIYHNVLVRLSCTWKPKTFRFKNMEIDPRCFDPFAAPKCRAAVLPAHTQVRSPRNWKSRRNYGVRLILSCDYGYTTTQRGTLVCDVPDWRLEPSSFKCFRKWLAGVS
jgi:hypothetical protein